MYTYNDPRLTYNSTLSTYNGADYYLPINALDTINISENYLRIEIDIAKVFELLDISEFVSVSIPNLGNINKTDNVNISENITNYTTLADIVEFDTIDISETIQRILMSDINSHDVIDISEDVVITNSLADIHSSDTVLISETVISYATLSDINETENVDISENIKEEMISFVFPFDSINISENIITSGQSFLNTYETINISEDIQFFTTLADINEVENINISDVIHPELVSFISSLDQLITTEEISTESFRFSPSDVQPIGSTVTRRPRDGKLSGFF